MEVEVKEAALARHQLPKLKSLLKKYRQLKTMQAGLLKLSEVASTVTDIETFYAALESVISSLLITDTFHIVLANQNSQLSLAHCHNPIESGVLASIQQKQWRDSLTELVYNQQEPIHCNAAERIALSNAGKITIYGSSCVDWLGVPLKRGCQTIGVIALQSYDQKVFFDDSDCQLLEFISEHLVTAIDRVRSRELLEKSIQKRTQKLTETNHRLQQEIAERQKVLKIHKAMLSISELTAATIDLNLFYQALHEKVKTLFQANNFYVAQLSKDKTEITFPYYVDEFITIPRARKPKNGLTELVLNKAKPLLVTNEQIITLDDNNEPRISSHSINVVNGKVPKAWLAAPLIDQDGVFGVLAIQHYRDASAYQVSDIELIRFVSQHISSAITRIQVQAKRQQNNAELETLVNERTKELQASNLNLRLQIEERRKAEDQLYYQAHHDALTQLPNRAMFSERLTYAIRHLKRHPLHRFAVLFIDLDRFKLINDTLGHHAGDQFLIEIATRLKECVRDNDVLARLGGDEFVVMLDSLSSTDDAEEIANRIISAIAQPFEIENQTLYSNASIGIAVCNNIYQDSDEVLRDADAAMYQAKSLGRGRYVFFDESMRDQLLATMTLEQELRIAIKQHQFELHYQEISDLACTDTIGYEAFLRWKHPKRGLLSPDEFLYIAEETGLIVEIETWVVEGVCHQLAKWERSPDNANAYIAINLSGRHLTHTNHLNDLITLIKDNTKEQHRLILEFNESAFSQQTDTALRGLKRLKEFGVKLALDDYGAGLSSFNFLHAYPFEFIKLDRSFISTINHNEKNLSLVKALQELGDKFGYRLVAEGIESAEMLKKLQTVGCEFGQGFYIDRPSKIEEPIPQVKRA